MKKSNLRLFYPQDVYKRQILLMEKVVDGFNFSAMEQAEKSLLDR